MRVLVFGAGVIGTIYGYAFSKAGVDVTHYVRPGKKKALQKGISIQLLDGRTRSKRTITDHYTPRIVESLLASDDYDLVIVSVRHYQVDSVLPILKDGVGKADVLFFNGNWSGLETVERALQGKKTMWGFPLAGGGFTRDGMLDAALLDEVRLGELDGQCTIRLDRVVDLFKVSGFKVDIQKNIKHWLWVHFAINSGVIGAAFKAGGQTASE